MLIYKMSCSFNYLTTNSELLRIFREARRILVDKSRFSVQLSFSENQVRDDLTALNDCIVYISRKKSRWKSSRPIGRCILAIESPSQGAPTRPGRFPLHCIVPSNADTRSLLDVATRSRRQKIG